MLSLNIINSICLTFNELKLNLIYQTMFERKPLEWDAFANELAFISSYSMMIGGTLGVVKLFPRWQIGLFSLIAGIFVLLLEYPRAYKKNVKVPARRFQNYVVPLVMATGKYGKSYYIRFVLHLCLGLPCCFLLPTLMGGLCLMIASATYLRAAICGQEWKPLHLKLKTGKPLKVEKSPLSGLEQKQTMLSLELMKETVC